MSTRAITIEHVKTFQLAVRMCVRAEDFPVGVTEFWIDAFDVDSRIVETELMRALDLSQTRPRHSASFSWRPVPEKAGRIKVTVCIKKGLPQ